MKKEISIKEFMTKLNEKGIEHMFFHGGTSELFGVENIYGCIEIMVGYKELA